MFSLGVQDPVYNVRKRFIERLCVLLNEKKIRLKYCVWLFLVAYEPEPELKNKACLLNVGQIVPFEVG